MSQTIDTALLGIFILIIAIFILLCLFLLSTPVVNYLITRKSEFNNGLSGGPPGYNG